MRKPVSPRARFAFGVAFGVAFVVAAACGGEVSAPRASGGDLGAGGRMNGGSPVDGGIDASAGGHAIAGAMGHDASAGGPGGASGVQKDGSPERPDGADIFCRALARGAVFESTELLWCSTGWGGPDAAPSPSMAPDLYCHWTLAFSASKVSWTQTDYTPSGTFACSGISVTALGESGTWDAARGVLSFSGNDYRPYRPDGGVSSTP